MTDQTADMHLPAATAGEWSLSSTDKKRLKRILVLAAAILLLLWLLFQLGQYTLALGTQPRSQIHIDGDWKRTVHPGAIYAPPFSGDGIDKKKEIPGQPPATLPIGSGLTGVPNAGQSDELLPAEPLGSSDPNSFTTPGIEGQESAGAGEPSSVGFGPIVPPGIGGGGSFPDNGGSGSPSDKGKGGDGNGNDDGTGPVDDPPVTHKFEVPSPYSGDPPDSNGDNPPDITTVGPIQYPEDAGTGDTPPVVQIPEPDSIFLFGAGLAALLGALCMKRRCRFLTAVAGMIAPAIIAGPASAETATVYGTTATVFSKNYGAFQPANTDLVCFSMNDANCWDGKKWHHLYPDGRRLYAVATNDRVACSVIVAPSNDCWTGSHWYRLPRGQVFGVIGGFFSNTPGAFITEPLRWTPKPHPSAPFQSPLGEFASKR
jgi:hypothetical protein